MQEFARTVRVVDAKLGFQTVEQRLEEDEVDQVVALFVVEAALVRVVPWPMLLGGGVSPTNSAVNVEVSAPAAWAPLTADLKALPAQIFAASEARPHNVRAGTRTLSLAPISRTHAR